MGEKTSIAHATIILMIGTVISKLLGFFREIIVAYQFGAGSISDAFLLTNSIPTLLFGSVATVVGISYIPYCQSIDNKEKIDYFTSNLLNIILVFLFAGCICVNVFPEIFIKIFGGGLNAETHDFAVAMLRIVVFSIIPIIVSHYFQAYSQINGQFQTTALFGIVTNIIIIAFTVISRDQTYYLLSLGVVIANSAGMLLALYGIKKLDYKYSFVLNIHDKDIKAIIILTIPLLIENIAYSLSLLVDRSLASYLDSGTISGLSYAGTIGNIASAMVIGSIITAVYPTLSRIVAKERESLDFNLVKYSKGIIFILCPLSFILVFCAKDISTFIFYHGAFSNSSLSVVWESLICYAVGVVPAGLQTYLIRCYYALKDTKTPVFIQVFALLCNITLNLLSVKYLKHMGIALSTSISYLIALIILAIMLKRKHKVDCMKRMAVITLCGVASALIAGISSFGVIQLLDTEALIIRLIIETTVFSVVYIGISGLIQRETLLSGINIMKSLIKK
ncbi:MAG: murein biosynthesis integral membrane protein MurJ [Mogibacterium sp.]|nr:murein biosynthesis integral membrane protein MurJ [Mogibacterium sp.]